MNPGYIIGAVSLTFVLGGIVGYRIGRSVGAGETAAVRRAAAAAALQASSLPDHAADVAGAGSPPPCIEQPVTAVTSGARPDSHSPARAPSYRDFLDAIREVEGWSPGDPRGKAGEIGPYQITPAFWRDGCEQLALDWPHDAALDRGNSERVIVGWFLRHLPVAWARQEWLTLAAAFHAGPRGMHTQRAWDYAKRVENLMNARR